MKLEANVKVDILNLELVQNMLMTYHKALEEIISNKSAFVPVSPEVIAQRAIEKVREMNPKVEEGDNI